MAAHTDWFLVSADALSVVVIVANAVLVRRNLRRSRQLIAEYDQVATLRTLLSKLAIDSFFRQHLPIWSCFAGTLGNLSVNVRTGPVAPEEDNE